MGRNFFRRPFGFSVMILCQIIGGPAFGPVGLFSTVFLASSAWTWGPAWFQAALAVHGLFMLIALTHHLERSR